MFSVFLGRVLRFVVWMLVVISLVVWVWCCEGAACLGLRLTLSVLGFRGGGSSLCWCLVGGWVFAFGVIVACSCLLVPSCFVVVDVGLLTSDSGFDVVGCLLNLTLSTFDFGFILVVS